MEFKRFYSDKHKTNTLYFELFVPQLINKFFKKHGKILDIGSGKQTRNVSLENKEVIFSDIALNALKTAKKKRLDAKFVTLNACTLPFKNNSIDSVLCKDILEHVRSDYDCVAEVFRILKQGGTVAVWVPKTLVKKEVVGWGHLRCYSEDTLKSLFSNFEQVIILHNRSWKRLKLGILLNLGVSVISILPWNYLPSFKTFENTFSITKKEFVLYLFEKYIDMNIIRLFPPHQKSTYQYFLL